MKDIIKLGIYLFIICAVAAVSLTGTNYFTAGRIREQKLNGEKQALKKVLPAAVSFKTRQDLSKDFIVGFDTKRNPVGYILRIEVAGYSSRIEALIGVDPRFKITGVSVLSQNETPGLGTKISSHSFLAQFLGKPAAKVRIKRDGGEIDAITSATISSRAITTGIRMKIDELKKTIPRI